MNDYRPSSGWIGVRRFPDETENGKWMIGNTVIRPAGVVILVDCPLAHIDTILLLLYLLLYNHTIDQIFMTQ